MTTTHRLDEHGALSNVTPIWRMISIAATPFFADANKNMAWNQEVSGVGE